ncbi:glycosyltransferase family 2 protein [Phormidesmis priestleyi]|uniref:glycosyltransferase family 2 protein n=1 Tax=Phormidesmis priestleyi TaxID=268141 RepID=UPI00083B22DD|nr:glycosyltransferase [Phormidesmis priestleyi]
MPVISVIVPAYNTERTILETIASLQLQTFSDFELIVINDGSTDRTLERLNTVRDARLNVFSYENAGVSIARNRGLQHATGNFITFIDADDLWTPDKLECQFAALTQCPQAGVAYSRTCFMDEQGKTFHVDNLTLPEGDVYAKLLTKNFLLSPGSNPLIRRHALESVNGFDPSLTHGEDWDLYLRLAARWEFVAVNKPQVFYRQSATSASSQVEVMEQNSLKVIEKSFQAAPSFLKPLKKQSLANLYQFLAHLYISRCREKDGVNLATQKLLTAVKFHPQILLQKKTLGLLFKLLLMRVLSPTIAQDLLTSARKQRANRMQVSQDDLIVTELRALLSR